MRANTKVGRNADESKPIPSSLLSGNGAQSNWIRAGRLVLSLLLFVGAAERTTSAAQLPAQAWHPQIIVSVHNYVQVDPIDLQKAEQRAADILRKAGVETVWLVCSAGEGTHGHPECSTPFTPLDLSLNLVASAKARHFPVAKDSYGFAVGSANNEFTSDAWVFFDLLQKAASEFQLNTSLVLGNIIAHELGHLLLGANAHSKWGLMRARWTREDLVAADRGELSFSNLERDRIHNAVIARYQAQGPLKAAHAPGGRSSIADNVVPSELRDDGFVRK